MNPARRGILCSGALVLAVAALAGCSSPSSPSGPSPSAAPGDLDLSCIGEGTGEGSPTVVLGSGLGTDSEVFRSLQSQLSTDMRVCRYSRAGLGASEPWPDDLPDPSAGMAADQLLTTLEQSGEQGPYVMLGWSYGGLVAQAFAAQHPDQVAGLVLEDAAAPEVFESEEWDEFEWAEGGRAIDTEATTDEVSDLDFGKIPLIVLSQGTMQDWPDPELWTEIQDRLTTLSDDAVHVIATQAGHVIHQDAPALVAKAVEDVREAVESGEPLECRVEEWAAVGGECQES